jgi:hypothetical protein
MPNTCPQTPYSRKNPYSPKQSPFTSKENPYTSKTVYNKRDNPYSPNQFCPFDLMLQENGYFIQQESGAFIAI